MEETPPVSENTDETEEGEEEDSGDVDEENTTTTEESSIEETDVEESAGSEEDQDSEADEESDIESEDDDTKKDGGATTLSKEEMQKIANLEAEVERLRSGIIGATEVITEIEEQPLPPIVGEDFVVPSHVVGDFVRLGRQLHREGLVHSTQGTIAMLNPDQPGVMHATRFGSALAQMTELDIISGKLGQAAPPEASNEWRIMEVLLASTSLHNGGPAACIHVHPPFSTTLSLEKDLIVLQPVDVHGKAHLGKVVIVDQDADDMDEYLRQIAEALGQGNMKCVVVRGHGVYAVGRNFTESWQWASALEHSMRIILLARQAGLRI
jgi:ribulose-5-phosphate 4-epimerase/fuculose-1-phosphate aldolase